MYMNLRDCRTALAMTLVTLAAGVCLASDNTALSDPPEGLPIAKVLECWFSKTSIDKDLIDHFYCAADVVVEDVAGKDVAAANGGARPKNDGLHSKKPAVDKSGNVAATSAMPSQIITTLIKEPFRNQAPLLRRQAGVDREGSQASQRGTNFDYRETLWVRGWRGWPSVCRKR